MHVIEVGQFLIAVIDRRAAENLLPEARRAGSGEVIAAVVELDIEDIQRYWIDVRSVASHIRTTERTEVIIARMIRRAICRAERGLESGPPTVAVANRPHKGCGKTVQANPVVAA